VSPPIQPKSVVIHLNDDRNRQECHAYETKNRESKRIKTDSKSFSERTVGRTQEKEEKQWDAQSPEATVGNQRS